MTIDKFGRYLHRNHQQTPQLLLKVLKHQVDCENRLLRNVREGIQKNDVVIKAQLDEVMKLCLHKIKKISRSLEEISEKYSTTTPSTSTIPTTTPVGGIVETSTGKVKARSKKPI